MNKQLNPLEAEKPERAYVYCGFPNRNNYIWGLSHNLYSDYSGDKHKTPAPHNDSLTPWSEHRIQATLDADRRQQLVESIFETILYALFGAMLVLAYLTD